MKILQFSIISFKKAMQMSNKSDPPFYFLTEGINSGI